MDLDVEAMLEAPFKDKRYDSYDSHRSHSRHKSRHRSPSYDRRRSSRYDERYRDDRRYRSRERHHRHRSRSPRSRTPDRRYRNRSASPPVPPEERDRRTVFVTQLAQRLKNRELHDFFSQAGRVRDARIITDKYTRRSKGVGYVEYYEESSVTKALELNGQILTGIPVLVQLTEAEKNRRALLENQPFSDVPAPALSVAQPNAQASLDQRLYVGSINYTITEEDLRQVFLPYGVIDFVDLHRDPATGRSKGFAFIQFRDVNSAKEALNKMNGFELGGRQLKVGMVTERTNAMQATSGEGGLDDVDGNGITLNSMSRAELMKKLAARDSGLMEQVTTQPVAAPPPAAAPAPQPTRTLLLSNMFNPDEETEPDWVNELQVDVKGECESYGPVEHIYVDSMSMGDIYVKFDSAEAGQRASMSLNGRWFGGRQVVVKFMPEHDYNTRFAL
ncbi:splicing factor, CC1-like protein [Hesseltinella vesiculosa]|uniref:Splicing factor, CC1-like protein n=1 Tax=Hesseltinella vesiculosa TaxID=101127 RepID=A0A1X2GVW1_9FUNG|nr:splicing factor, CC1-like protein [Hesseltinella vesiculosa]